MFDFFGLPRELRDEIYKHALESKVHIKSPSSVRISVANGPSTSLQLTSRQFRSEYLDAARTDGLLILQDVCTRLPTIALSEPLRSLPRVEFRLWLVCGRKHEDARYGCRALEELDLHARWVRTALSQMRTPEAIFLVTLCNCPGIETCKVYVVENQTTLTRLPGFRDLILYQGDFDFANTGAAEPKVVMMYSAETQQLEPIEGKTDDIDFMRKRAFGFSGDKRMWYEAEYQDTENGVDQDDADLESDREERPEGGPEGDGEEE